MSSINRGTIANAAGSNESMRILLNAMADQFDALSIGTGIQLLQPTSGGQNQTPNTPKPGTATLSVTGSNGIFTGTITPPAQTLQATLYYEVSYSATSNFTSATTLPLSPSTTFTISSPGQTLYWRVRATYDKTNFGPYTMTSGGNPSVASGLVSSGATDNAVNLNQTNYAVVDSVPGPGGTANVRVYGAGGPLTQWIGVKGPTETVFPSGTIINQTAGTNPYVGYDGEQFIVKSTLPQVFGDNVTPVGQVGVPPGGVPILPTITLVLGGALGDQVVGYNVTGGGANLSAPVTLNFSGPGTRATGGPQTIVGGVLQSIGPGNPGNGYGVGSSVAATGGVSTGTTGGGGISGSNPGRYIPPLATEE